MELFELNDFNQRIELNVDLKYISKEICHKYNIGGFISQKLIEIGYEDYNYILETTQNKYCVKILNHRRNKEEIEDYLDRIRHIANTEIQAPKPLSIDRDICWNFTIKDNYYNIIVFEYIDGLNYFELNSNLDDDEIKTLAKEAAIINKIDYKPKFIYDSWSIVNFAQEYKIKRKYLSQNLQKEFDILLDEFNKIDINKLSRGYAHGDLIKTNIMKDKEDKIWLLDFAVSNYYPIILELAVLSCNVCLVKESKEKTLYNINLLLREYEKYNQLSMYDKKYFPLFYKLANAMHIMCTTYIANTEGDSEENKYWYNEGMVGYSFSEYLEMNGEI